MRQSDGTTTCDGCGADVGDGGLNRAVVVSDLTARGLVINLHFCRANEEGKPCATRLLTARWLQKMPDYVQTGT